MASPVHWSHLFLDCLYCTHYIKYTQLQKERTTYMHLLKSKSLIGDSYVIFSIYYPEILYATF